MSVAKLKKPNVLKRGNTVALIATCSPFNRELFDQATRMLKTEFDLKVVWEPSIFDRDHYLAGSDERKIKEFLHWMKNPEVDAMFLARGGYGSARIYPTVLKELKKIKSLKPKVVLGYSDFTIFLNGLRQDLGWTTFHGPVIASKDFLEADALERRTFLKSMFEAKPMGEVFSSKTKTLVKGKAIGQIVGGCLSILASSLGTSYEIETKGKILFLEDVTEKPHRIDRLCTQLLHAGKFDHIKGLIFGDMHECGDEIEVQHAIRNALLPHLQKKQIPTITHFPAGHARPQITFAMGTQVLLSATEDEAIVEFQESGVKAVASK